MAITHGSKAKISIGGAVVDLEDVPDASYAEWLTCDLFMDATWNQQRGEVEVTTNRDGMDDAFIPGHRNRTFDFSVAFDEANEAQAAILDNYEADEELVWFRHRPQGNGAGLPEIIFAGFVTNCPVSTPGKDKATMQVTVRVSGKPTRRPQAA